ncbi:MAG: hypothetical protein EOP53_07400 [Sphingobacteriales bacterium]|nr:MAG: hypothetical protein EOP53_07400 [Sphingobacteriales bacterium]
MQRFFKVILFVFFLFTASNIYAQDDLLQMLESEDSATTDYTRAAFKTTRVINSHSLENVAEGVLDFKILHRFGFINGGAYEFFGLDQATMRLGFEYGITDRLMVGIGRTTVEKALDGFLKYKILRQSSGAKNMPLTLTYATGLSANMLKWQDPNRNNFPSSRFAFYHQLIVGRKFSEAFTLQLMPTLVHRNLVQTLAEKNDVYAMGIAGRQKLTRRMALNAEYYYVLPNQLSPDFTNSLSVGFDIETGGHVFQLHFTNSTPLNEKGVITETRGKWSKGDIHFGFNISRVFTIRDRSNKS